MAHFLSFKHFILFLARQYNRGSRIIPENSICRLTIAIFGVQVVKLFSKTIGFSCSYSTFTSAPCWPDVNTEKNNQKYLSSLTNHYIYCTSTVGEPRPLRNSLVCLEDHLPSFLGAARTLQSDSCWTSYLSWHGWLPLACARFFSSMCAAALPCKRMPLLACWKKVRCRKENFRF